MDSARHYEAPVSYVPASVTQSAKIVIAGGFGVGKTTLIGSVSDVTPLRMEQPITQDSVGVDDLRGTPGKKTTTVGMDFGRLHLSDGDGGDQIALYLFGLPGQMRFRLLWQELADGAMGCLVLADTRDLDACHPALDLLDALHMPHTVAINTFPDAPSYPETELRQALALDPGTPLTFCDARDRTSSMLALITLVEHLPALRADTLLEPLR